MKVITVRYHGGWLAPRIYFLGFSGCIQVNGVRIAGSSGIYKSHDYQLGVCALSHPSMKATKTIEFSQDIMKRCLTIIQR